MKETRQWNRRDLIKVGAAAGLLPSLALAEEASMITRPIPVSGEALPVVGLGTWQVFDVDSTPGEIDLRRQIVQHLTHAGGRLIDTSPMYNRSENVIGDIIESGVERSSLFLATKVWTDGKASGIRQMEQSAKLMNTDVIDLMQVHNRRDLEVHMPTIREWQEDARIRYNGVTDYRESVHDEMAAVMKRYQPDFIQINYSLGEHGADDRVLPLAADLGIAVLVNRPFMSGRLFQAVRDRELPDWAHEFANSWGQFFLKFIISHPAVTCVIPATSQARHMADNLGAAFGRLPDAATRERMLSFVGAI